jgi:threonine synthase
VWLRSDNAPAIMLHRAQLRIRVCSIFWCPAPSSPFTAELKLRYVSTRGQAEPLTFSDVLLTGLAPDGGLYVPEIWPTFDHNKFASFAGNNYADVAFDVARPFIGDDLDDSTLAEICASAYATFRHDAVAPLVQIDANHFILELFHGPTMAFKDVAMQFLGRVMDHTLKQRDQRATIVAATSGDTGGAAIEAFAHLERADIFVLFPKGRVSPVQQRQMTTVDSTSVHALAVEGTFDDCQAMVKAMFGHETFRQQVKLSAVNSINWARILAQMVYFITSATALGSPHRPVSFCVPTGNFGDIFAGYAAKRLGLPIDQLVVATNVNDILYRALKTGRYELSSVVPTVSPSMDIQISSNFERLLFDAYDRDGNAVRRLMNGLTQSGSFSISETALGKIAKEFSAGRTDEAETLMTMRETQENANYLLDPHTAAGVHVAKSHLSDNIPMITLATAHPAKFPAAVMQATGETAELPAWQGNLMEREERYTVIANQQSDVEQYILKHCRATSS